MSLTVADNETSTTSTISITQDWSVDYDGDEESVDKLDSGGHLAIL